MSDDQTEERTVVKSENTRSSSRVESPPVLVIWLPKSRRGEQFIVDRDMTLGRSSVCDIVIDDASMSKRHAEILVKDDEVFIKDLQSTNKTYIDRNAIEPLKPIPLDSNCALKMGSTIFMYYTRGNIDASNISDVFKQAYMDPLTDVLNKRAMSERGPELLEKAISDKQPLSVIMFDIDHFKKINDGHPERHLAGDYVLKEMTALIQSKVIRVEDLFARFGGEEFVVSLLGADKVRAHEIAERIRKTVEQYPFTYGGTPIRVTVSLGVTQAIGPDDEWEEIIRRADQALYQSKNNGRNRTTLL